MNELRGLWRGKRVDYNDWVEGDLQLEHEKGTPYYLITDRVSHWAWLADQATLGECTGLRDKNGKLIFKGDIVEVRGEDCFAVVGWGENTARFVLNFVCADEISDFDSYCGYECEIIGNIHDNPEIIKSKS